MPAAISGRIGRAVAGTRTYSLINLEEIAFRIHPALDVVGKEIAKGEAELHIAEQYPNPVIAGSLLPLCGIPG